MRCSVSWQEKEKEKAFFFGMMVAKRPTSVSDQRVTRAAN